MMEFLFSPRGANIVSIAFLIPIVAIIAPQLFLSEKTRAALLSRFRRKPDSTR